MLAVAIAVSIAAGLLAPAQEQEAKVKQKKTAEKAVSFPPALPDGKQVVTDTSEDFLKPPASIRKDVVIARTPPKVDFLYFPGQTYEGKPWSNWGDSLCANGKYYASIGDHLAPNGNAFVFEYDPETWTFRLLADLRQIIGLPDGHYTPGKIHGRLDIGSDGWIYFSTHRGSPKVTNDTYHYKGDWIIRVHPGTGKSEVVVQGAVPKHCVPCSVLDPQRLIFYGGTAQGSGAEDEGIQFFAYDVKNKKLLYSGDNGPARYMIFAKSTGRIYFNPGKDISSLMRWDPDQKGPPVKIPGEIGIRAATQETPQGYVYTVSQGQKGQESLLYAFNTKTEKVEVLGPLAAGSQQYVASLDVDPTGRFLYYIAGAHGGSDADGSPVVQFDTKSKQKKVIAFLHPFYEKKYGAILRGTYSTAIDDKGEKLFVTWNVSRGSRAWDCCALTVIHIPKSERE
jgi:hypothetical protein